MLPRKLAATIFIITISLALTVPALCDSELDSAILRGGWTQVYDMLSSKNAMADTIIGNYLRKMAHSISEPNEPIGQYQEHIKRSDALRIREWAGRLNSEYPDNPKAIFVLAMANSTCGNDSEAVELLSRAIGLDKHLAYILYWRGVLYLFGGSFEKAIADFDATLSADSNYVPSYIARGNAYARMGNHKQAITDYSHAIKSGSKDISIYAMRAQSYEALDSLPLAILDLFRSIDKDSTYAPAYLQRSRLYAGIFAIDLSMEDCESFLKYAPPEMADQKQRTANLLKTFRENGDSVEQHPAQYYLQQGREYLDRKECAAAFGYFLTALKKSPNFVPPIYWLGAVFDELKYPRRAIAKYDLAVSLAPDDADAYFMRARGYCRRHMLSLDTLVPQYKFEDALKDYGTALALNPKKTEVYFWRGMTNFLNLQDQGASQDLSYFIDHAATNDSLLVKIARGFLDKAKK